MVFWRSRAAKTAEAPVIVAEERQPGSTIAGGPVTVATEAETETVADEAPAEQEALVSETGSNVVPLVKPRLADRLADITDRTSSKRHEVAAPLLIAPADADAVIGQAAAINALREALSSARPGEHTLVLGVPGTGRLTAVRTVAHGIERTRPDDWIYVVSGATGGGARALPLPPAQGQAFVRDARIAIDKAAANLRRQLGSDEHRLDVELLDEEMRFRADKAVEGIRRRAESQNIALVKSLDGYVLAPMHEGRVVRSDVFHALPEALRRNVEAKISVLEAELQQTVAALPTTETQLGEKYEALFRETARRALKPYAVAVGSVYSDSRALAAIETIEAAFLAWGTALAAGSAASEGVQIFALNDVEETPSRALLLEAHEASPLDLVGRLSCGRDGKISVKPGYLTRASGGFVLIEAWKLAADPKSWLALSASLARSEVVPRCAANAAFEAEPLPLTATVVLVADADSWTKLCAIEPGAARHFQYTASLRASAPASEVSEADFGGAAARLASDTGLMPLEAATLPLIYKDATARGGGNVSLDRIALLQTLRAANRSADRDKSEHIRAADIVGALARSAPATPP